MEQVLEKRRLNSSKRQKSKTTVIYSVVSAHSVKNTAAAASESKPGKLHREPASDVPALYLSEPLSLAVIV